MIAQQPCINISISVLFTSLYIFISLFSRFLFKICACLLPATSVRCSGICGFVCGMFEMKETRENNKKRNAKKLRAHIRNWLDISEYWIYGCANFASFCTPLSLSISSCDLHSAVIICLYNRSMLHITIDTIQWIIIIKRGRLLNLLHRLFLCTLFFSHNAPPFFIF